jgi:hypothetical protein
MATIVVYGGGFQPFHEGHLSSYLQAKKALPDATFYVAASNDVKQRPIPFKDKQFLAQQAGVVDPFVETKNPINPQEILAQYNPEQDVYIMVRSERDPVSYTKKDGSPAYYQPYVPGEPMAPFSKHGYVFVSKKHTFTVNGEEVYSGSQVRSMYGSADDAGRMKIIQQLYPKSKQQQMIKKLLDKYLASPQEPAVVPTKTTAMSKLKNKALAEQISKIRPLIKEASPAMKLKFMRLMKTAISESKVNELSPQTLASYKKKAGADATASDKAGDYKRGDKRMSGIIKATKKEFDNDAKGVKEARTNPERNLRAGSGKYDLINYAEDIRDKDNWAVSMTMEPKLGINPQAAVSEDTPKGIYFYPLKYFMQMADRDESLPWGDNFPYLQLFQYDRSGEMTQETQVDPTKLKQALRQYCSDEIIQQAIDEPEYDGTSYWFIYDCLSRLGKSDETNVVRWNKVLRDLGFTSVFDPGRGWIAYNEPTQGVVLDPRIIKQHKMFDNRNPTLQHRRYDIQGLADSIGWSSYYQSESQLQRIRYDHPNKDKVMLDVAKSMLKPFLGKSSEEAKEMGYDQALKAAADKVIEILKQPVNEGIENPYGYEVGQTVKLDNGLQGRVIDIFDDAIEVLLTTGKTITVAFQDAHVMDTLDEANGYSLGKVLSWPEVANKISSAMKAMGWKGQRKGDDSYLFSTKGAEDESQYYMVMIDNEGNGMFTYALGTFEGGRPDIGEQATLPTTEASVSEVLMAIREGYGLNEQQVNEAFDQPYKLKWEKSGTDITATTKLDDGGHLGIMFQKGYNQDKEEAWSVEFYRNNSQEVTGEGDAQRVFSTVLSSIQAFIKKYKPNKVMFAASKETDDGQNSQSRARLYDSLVQRYAKSWGFRAFRAETGNKVFYELTRRDPVKETSDDPWGDQGNFAGDKPVNIGGDIVKRLGVGDIVSYLGQKAKILAQSKPEGKYSRITIASDFGGTTKDVLTSDLKRLGGNVKETNVSESKDYLEEK